MKKLITLLTAAVLSINTVFAADIIKKEYDSKDETYSVVYRLGIIDESEAEDEDVILTRGDFLKIAYNIKNYDNKDTEPSANTSYFRDVGVYHYAAGYIQFLVSAGVVKGYETGDFLAEQEITVDEAARMLLRCAGYGVYEDYGFGSLSTYISQIKKDVGQKVTYEAAAKMVYNLLFTDTMKLTTVGNAFGYETSDIVLKEILNMDYVDGTVEAVGGICLYDKEVSDSEIIVDENNYEASENITVDLLGMYARVIIDDGVAVAAMPLKNTVMIIAAEDIEGVSGDKVYYNDGDKSRTVKTAKTKDILYNGYAVESLTGNLPEYGNITLIDRNSDGTYDVVLVEEYHSYLVKSAGVNSEGITVKTNDGEKTFILKDYEKSEVLKSSGSAAKLASVAENDVVMLYTYKKEYIKVIVITDKREITIKGFGTNTNGHSVIKSEDSEYEYYDNYYVNSEPALGETVTLCLDATGKVVGIISKSSPSWKYGYVVFARMAMNDDGEDRVLMKFVNESGEMEKLYCDEKTYVNGTKMTVTETFDAISAAYNNFADTLVIDGKECENYTTRLMRYYQVGDVIRRVDTPTIRSMYNESKMVTSSNDQLLLHAKGELYRPENQSYFKTVYANWANVAGDIYYDTGALIFVIPTDTNTNPEDDDYEVVNASSFVSSGGKHYHVAGYACDANTLKTHIAVVRKDVGASSDATSMIVNNVNRVVDDDDQVVYQVETLGGSKYTVNERSSAIDPSTVKKGDILMYEVSNGELVIDALLYRVDGDGKLNSSTYYSTDGVIHFNSTFRALRGTAGKQDGSYVQTMFTGGPANEIFTISSSVNVIDLADGKMKLYIGTRNDISYGDEIIITSRKGNASLNFYVIKK